MLMRWVLGFGLLGLLILGIGGCAPKAQVGADEDKDTYLLAGRDWMASGNAAKARKNFEQALTVNPNSALAHYELGLLNERFERDYVSAIYHYKQATRLRADGYPSDNAKVRIESCKQELVKAELLAPVAQNMVRELERLRKDNAILQAQLESRPMQVSNRPSTNDTTLTRRSTRGQDSSTNTVNMARRTGLNGGLAQNGSSTMHVVRSGETIYRIARAYKLSESQLLQANRGVNPKSLVVGTRLQIPNAR